MREVEGEAGLVMEADDEDEAVDEAEGDVADLDMTEVTVNRCNHVL